MSEILEGKVIVLAGIQGGMALVNDFHEKLGVSAVQRLTELSKNYHLMDVAKDIKTVSKMLIEHHVANDGRDMRYLRAHLLCEELGELVHDMADCNEESSLDGLADLLYVLFGTAVTLDLPLSPAFMEVHRSNMTKEKQPDDVHKDRVRQKGPNYSPPDIKSILAKHREG